MVTRYKILGLLGLLGILLGFGLLGLLRVIRVIRGMIGVSLGVSTWSIFLVRSITRSSDRFNTSCYNSTSISEYVLAAVKHPSCISVLAAVRHPSCISVLAAVKHPSTRAQAYLSTNQPCFVASSIQIRTIAAPLQSTVCVKTTTNQRRTTINNNMISKTQYWSFRLKLRTKFLFVIITFTQSNRRRTSLPSSRNAPF
jgi:hypothetical protein